MLGFVIAVAFVVLLLALLAGAAPRRVSGEGALEARYLRRTPGPPAEARALLERQLKRLAEQYPGKSRRWYLQRLLAETERARR